VTPEAERGLEKADNCYNMKAIADYDTTPGAFVSREDAAPAIETATRFVECIRRILTPRRGPTP
jgi:HEPN domain-containing protein